MKIWIWIIGILPILGCATMDAIKDGAPSAIGPAIEAGKQTGSSLGPVAGVAVGLVVFIFAAYKAGKKEKV